MKIQICKKCKHFQQHYVNSKFLGFFTVNCGHCHKKLIKKANCESFEEYENIEEKDISIINSFLSYERKLNKLINEICVLVDSTRNLKKEIISFELEKKHK